MSLKLSKQWTIESLAYYISEIMEKETGNVLQEKQQTMVQSRLKKRITDLNLTGPEDYVGHFESNYKDEVEKLVSILTTHHTYFFRETLHFDFITDQLGMLAERLKSEARSTINIYCGACSRGHEVYTLALFLEFHMKKYSGIDFRIYASDIDPECVAFAKKGVYSSSEMKSIPAGFLNNSIRTFKEDNFEYGEFSQKLKSKCHFSVTNLLEPRGSMLEQHQFDIVICRNVFIYFNPETIKKIVATFKKQLHPEGFLITGVSESLIGLIDELSSHAPSVYSFGEIKQIKQEAKKVKRVLNVDDSRSTLKLLKRLFDDVDEFELVGQVGNGEEAHEFLKKNKVDLMTLDLHMPVMDGVTYLETHFNDQHPPVIIISSANREDKRYSQRALSLGAVDFVEKPTLHNLLEKREEIINKVSHLDFSSENADHESLFKVDEKENLKEKGVVFLLATSQDKENLEGFFRDLSLKNTPVVVLNYGHQEISLDGVELNKLNTLQNVTPSHYIGDLHDFKSEIVNEFSEERVSLCVFGKGPVLDKNFYNEFLDLQILLEERDDVDSTLKKQATDIFPTTSFEFVCSKYIKLGGGASGN